MIRKFIAIPQFFTGLILYIIHFFLRNIPQYNFTTIRWYIGDVFVLIVCIPIIVNSQILFGIRKRLYITLFDVLLYWIIFSLYFEIIMPNYSENITGDVFDIIAYLIGGLILLFSQKEYQIYVKRKFKNIKNKANGT